MDDTSLWRIARARSSRINFDRYQELLDKNRNNILTDTERAELKTLRSDSDRLMLRKAHVAALLKWRGHQLSPAD